jgi:hypothetical protein
MDVTGYTQEIVRRRFDHLLWLGGSPCAGKSSIARCLSKRHALRVYSADAERDRLQPLIDAEHQPVLYKWTHTRWHDLWMQPQETLLAEAIDAYKEHFLLLLGDLMTLPHDLPILVEGSCLLPHCVSGLLSGPRSAVWVVPSDEFQRRHYPTRGEWVHHILADCDAPQLALQQWMDRDVAFARMVIQHCEHLGYAYLTVDGNRTIEQNADWVADRLALEAA